MIFKIYFRDVVLVNAHLLANQLIAKKIMDNANVNQELLEGNVIDVYQDIGTIQPKAVNVNKH